ncbi:hypothetical protein CH1034_180032 [Klebsiella pneumoniae]|nr:hypothetical protein CH1034_180032 [Klebsiella pneumoniae]
MVSRPASLRHRAAFRLRSGLRTPHRLRDRRAERPRCYSVPADAAQRDILNFSDINLKGQRKLAFFYVNYC